VDSESLSNRSAGSIVCGIFSIVLILSLVALPGQSIHTNLKQQLKDIRPYKADVTQDTIRKHFHPLFAHTQRELRFNDMVIKAAQRHNVDAALIKAIIMAESGYNHRAISKKGAVGLMQLMPSTASALGVTDPFNPELNVNGGVKYFKRLLNQFKGDLELALAAYNAGSGKVKKYNGIPPFKATRIYIQKVFKYYWYYKDVRKA
jgi:soluble lytic murein transglycosylase-like protein